MEPQPGRMLQDEALKAALADRGAAVVSIAAGDRSMEPTLRGGDAILAVPIEGPPRIGDLLVFRQRDYLVVHRFLGAAHDPDGRPYLRTRGDGRFELDPPLLPAELRGKAAAVRRGATWRSMDGSAAHGYARLLAWHDLAWAWSAHLARRVGLQGAVAAVDRALLGIGAAVILPLVHRRIAPPEGAVPRLSV